MGGDSATALLFSYGSLRDPEVQRGTFGRVVRTEGDVLPGYTVDYAEVEDHREIDDATPRIVPVVRETGSSLDKVVGSVLHLDEDELDACDEYQASLYRRARVVLASGRAAWVYLDG
ncbi:gamma-glutamylcyclotransferase family protein [Microbacterium sp. Marseille-Q6648]|uniref:gamma-glutamylcyclotransferase family protein n=1 Tax=Microbacterium sp. Marseille-Q6648 TaxID=2937991 RepID=UPI00203DCD6A|nr:gamma-glutamylcyclotransferase family protein [Microbacterium sp. Marseille-Q6648]